MGTGSLQTQRDYRRGVFSLEMGRLYGHVPEDCNIVIGGKEKSRQKRLLALTTRPRAQSLSPLHPLYFFFFLSTFKPLLPAAAGDRTPEMPAQSYMAALSQGQGKLLLQPCRDLSVKGFSRDMALSCRQRRRWKGLCQLGQTHSPKLRRPRWLVAMVSPGQRWPREPARPSALPAAR